MGDLDSGPTGVLRQYASQYGDWEGSFLSFAETCGMLLFQYRSVHRSWGLSHWETHATPTLKIIFDDIKRSSLKSVVYHVRMRGIFVGGILMA